MYKQITTYLIFSILTIVSFSTACNTATEPTEKTIPEGTIVEEGNATEMEILEEVVDQTAIMEAELEALEAALEHPSRSHSDIEVKNDPENPVEKCMRRCEQIQNNMEYPTQSGSTVNAYEECIANCQELENLGNEFQKCINNATTEEDKKACRQHYMDNRPWSHTE